MASRNKKTPPAKKPITGPRSAQWDYTDSVFWKRIVQAGDSALETAIRDMVEGAKELAARVAGELPTFTKHDETHLTNVLYWMEAFATPDALDEMGVVGCAFCILLAYTHDLGMVPAAGWRERVARDAKADSDDRQRFEGWCAQHHPDLVAFLERLLESGDAPSAGERERARWIETHLQNDYLRATHADADAQSRVAGHLKRLDEAGRLKAGFKFICAPEKAIELLTWMAAGHNQSADWLREKTGKDHPAGKFRAKAGDANILLPAYLLRLADIADFDRTRAPTVVFHQLGLEDFSALRIADETVPAEKVRALGFSASEWMKHLAIDRWSWKGEELVYVASDCRHPAIHQSILRFLRLIEAEVNLVRAELEHAFLGRASLLRLPGRVLPDITRCGYHYEDLAFHLQAHEVTQLLMGTSLYGERELCLRELLQNALDAVQLRERRWQLRQKLGASGVPVPEALGPSAAWIEGTPEEPGEKELPIRVTWGRDEAVKREWIAVEDFGTGMTLEQLKTYFAALGRSFYKSPGYKAEARVLREQGYPVEAISQFGIGVLSCFMVAEWMEVETLACGERAEALWVRITGPGALFHIQRKGEPGGRNEFRGRPGTKITLYLKRDLHLVELSQADFLTQVRRDLGYRDGLDVKAEAKWLKQQEISGEREQDGETWLNPAAAVMRHVVWPGHAIGLCMPWGECMPWGANGRGTWFRFDETTHLSVLAPIDQAALRKAAEQEGVVLGDVGEVIWWTWDWRDDHEGKGTGSRIRVVVPLPREADRPEALPALGDRHPDWLLAGLVGLQARHGEGERLLVRGMHVDEMVIRARSAVPLAAGLGGLVWIDLAGEAAPRLTADRKTARPPVGKEEREWLATLHALWGRWGNALRERMARNESRAGWLLSVWLADSLRVDLPRPVSSFARQLELLARRSGAMTGLTASQRMALTSRWLALARDSSHADDLARDRDRDRGLTRDLARDRYRTCAFALEKDCNIAENLDLDLDFDFDFDCAPVRATQFILGSCFLSLLECHFLNHGFWPESGLAFPLLAFPASAKRLDQAGLMGPALIEWAEENEARGGFHDYDAVAPFTVVAGPGWRVRFPVWEQAREWRPFLLLPVLLADDKLAQEFSDALKKKAAEHVNGLPDALGKGDREKARRLIEDARRLQAESLFVLIPRPDLWEKPFAEWTVADEATAGYSALFDIAEGKLYFAAGVVRSRAELRRPEREVKRFLADKDGELAEFRRRCPDLFKPEEAPEEEE